MNKHFIILFLVLSSILAHGQSDSNIQRLIALTDNAYFPDVQAKLDSFSALFSGDRTEGKLKFYNNHRPFRSYGMEISQYTLNFEHIHEIRGSTFKSDRYKLTILFDSMDSTIFYTKIVNYTGYGRMDYEIPISLRFDSVRFETYFALHDSLFATESVRNYASPPFFSNKYFGPECMNHVAPQHDEMLKAVATKRKDILLTWLKSFNIEDKTYGATGLYLYKKDGGILSDEEEILLKRTQRLRADVQTDLGIRYIYYFLSERSLEKEFEDYFDEKSQENKLIYALNDFVNVDQFYDSSAYDVSLKKLVFEMTETLQHDDITTFRRFKQVADSLDFSYEMKPSKSSEYALFMFRYGNDKWNYVLKNREIVFKEEQVFHFFYEVHELNPNEFLLITLLNDMSYSCYEALVFNDLNRITGNKCVSVCSWTNVVESYIDGRDSLTGEPVIIGRMASYEPIPINYNSKRKSISYSFERLENGKIITRKANYKKGRFIIESYNANDEVNW